MEGQVQDLDAGSELMETIKDRKAVVVFWAPCCEPCRMFNMMLKRTEDKIPEGILVLMVNTDENPIAAQTLGISCIPVLVFLDNGAEKYRIRITSANIITEEEFLQRIREIFPDA